MRRTPVCLPLLVMTVKSAYGRQRRRKWHCRKHWRLVDKSRSCNRTVRRLMATAYRDGARRQVAVRSVGSGSCYDDDKKRERSERPYERQETRFPSRLTEGCPETDGQTRFSEKEGKQFLLTWMRETILRTRSRPQHGMAKHSWRWHVLDVTP